MLERRSRQVAQLHCYDLENSVLMCMPSWWVPFFFGSALHFSGRLSCHIESGEGGLVRRAYGHHHPLFSVLAGCEGQGSAEARHRNS